MPGKGKIFDLASRAVPRRQQQQQRPVSDASYGNDSYNRSASPASSYDQMSSNAHGAPQEVSYGDPLLIPPNLPFSEVTGGVYGSQDGHSSRQSSYHDLTDLQSNSKSGRAPSLSINYVPTKFTKLHTQGEWAHRRAKQGGGRDAFAANAQRMGDLGTVDDDEGLVFQLGKGGLKAKHQKKKLRWNRFKWALFIANSVVSCSLSQRGTRCAHTHSSSSTPWPHSSRPFLCGSTCSTAPTSSASVTAPS